jgi:hypothetical protein
MSDFDLSTLPADVQSLFARDDVKAFLTKTIEGAKAPLVSKRDELLANLTETKTHLQKVNELGGLEALTAAQQARAEAAEAKRQADLIKAEKEGDLATIRKNFQDEVSKRDTELSTLRQSILAEKVDAALTNAVTSAKGVPELLMSALKARIKSEMVDGKARITVLGADGVAPLKELTIDDLVNEFKSHSVYQRAFEANGVSGTGGRQSTGASTSDNPFAKASFNLTKQMAMYRENPSQAIRLAAEQGIKLD